MPARQLTFWDNEALELGYHFLNDLQFQKAISHFNEALFNKIAERDSIQQLITVCEYWHPRIQYVSVDDSNRTEKINALIGDYSHYVFSRQIDNFKNALLQYIVSLLIKEPDMDLNDTETVFDLLVKSSEFQKAEELVSCSIVQHPGNPQLMYLLAQAQWFSNNRNEANNNYGLLLLCHPGKTELNRIENKKLTELILTYGSAFAPIYGWLRNVMNYVPLPEKIEIYDEEHRKALAIYRLFYNANKALESNNIKETIRYRKEIKTLMPAIYTEYFNWLEYQK